MTASASGAVRNASSPSARSSRACTTVGTRRRSAPAAGLASSRRCRTAPPESGSSRRCRCRSRSRTCRRRPRPRRPKSSRQARARDRTDCRACRNAGWRRRRRTRTRSCWSWRRSRRRLRAGAARPARRLGRRSPSSNSTRDPARVTSPATSNRSLMLTIAPSSGPSGRPIRIRASAASASRARAVGIDGQAGARPLARRVGDASKRLFEPVAGGGLGHRDFRARATIRYRAWPRPAPGRGRRNRAQRPGLDSERLRRRDLVVSPEFRRPGPPQRARRSRPTSTCRA